MKDEHEKDAAQGAAEDVTEDVPQDAPQNLALGAWAARALLATAAASIFMQLMLLRWGRNWAAQWRLARAVGRYQAPAPSGINVNGSGLIFTYFERPQPQLELT